MSQTVSLSDYQSLITSEHQNKPKFMAMLRAFVEPIINVSRVNHNMSTLMNLDTASGSILDLIGRMIGVSRQLDFTPASGDSPVLNDDYYRLILKAKIAKNQWKGTKKDFYTIWRILFPDNPIFFIDNQNMTAQVIIVGLEDELSQELITHGYIVPKPAGVRYIYGFLSDTTFAFDLNTDLMKGWDLGSWLNLVE